jgi:tape measure domain-containing protein
MADDALSWQFQLYDEISAPANSAAAGVEKVVAEMTTGEKVVQSFEKELGRVRAQLAFVKGNPGQFKELQLARKELGDLQRSLAPASVDAEKMVKTFRDGAPVFAGIGSFGIAQGASMLVSAGEKYVALMREAATVVYGFTERAIKAAAQSQTVGLSFELMLGEAGGRQALADIEEIASRTKFTAAELEEAVRPLLLAGVKPGKQMADALAAAIDAEALTGGGIGAVGGVIETITQVMSKGGIEGEALKKFGINAPAFFKTLAKDLGMSVDTLKEKLGAGKIKVNDLLNSIYREMAVKQGGALGISAERGAGTVEARLKKLTQLPDVYLRKFVSSPGFNDLSNTLGDILHALDPESPSGQRIYKALEGVFSDLMRWVRDITTPGNIEALAEGFSTAVDFSRTLLATVRQVFEVFARFVELTSKIANAPFKLGSFLTGESSATEKAVGTAGSAAGARRAAALLGYGDILADAGITLPALPARSGDEIRPSRGRGNRAPLMALTIPIDARGAKGDEAAEEIADKLQSTAVPQIKSLLETYAAQQGVQDDDG